MNLLKNYEFVKTPCSPGQELIFTATGLEVENPRFIATIYTVIFFGAAFMGGGIFSYAFLLLALPELIAKPDPDFTILREIAEHNEALDAQGGENEALEGGDSEDEDEDEDEDTPEMDEELFYSQVSRSASVGAQTRLGAITVPASVAHAKASKVTSHSYNPAVDMGHDLQNTLVIGKGGAGKGILLSNAIRYAQKANPALRVVGIDPKGAETEDGYWSVCHEVYRLQSFGKPPEIIAKWINESIDSFMALPPPKLLVIDECKHISQTLKRCNDKGQAFNLFWYRIESFTSLGDEQQTYVWAISQTAHTQDLAVSGGTRSMFRAIGLVHYKDPGYTQALVSTELIPVPKLGVNYIQDLIQESPVGRAFYCSKKFDWFPMPKLDNYSSLDRDTRTVLKATISATDSPVVEQAKQAVRIAPKPQLNGVQETSEVDFTELPKSIPQAAALKVVEHLVQVLNANADSLPISQALIVKNDTKLKKFKTKLGDDWVAFLRYWEEEGRISLEETPKGIRLDLPTNLDEQSWDEIISS